MAEKKPDINRLIKLLAKRERIQKRTAYPPPGEIWQKFKNIAQFDPEAAERLTQQEYGIRRVPYEAGAQYREQIERARQQIQVATERETQKRRRAEALQKIWFEEKTEWAPERVKLELQRRGMEKYYKPLKIQKPRKEKISFAERINRLMKNIGLRSGD